MTFNDIKNIDFGESLYNDNSLVIRGDCLEKLTKIEL